MDRISDGRVISGRPYLMSLAAAAILIPPMMILQLIGSVDLASSAKLATVVAIQSVSGLLILATARKAHQIPLLEMLGLGIPLGALLSVASSQLLLPTPIQAWAWILPTLVALTLSVIANERSGARLRVQVLTLRQTLLVSGVLTAGLVLLLRVWATTPLRWSGWMSYFGDIPIHEATANSLAQVGPSGSLMLLGGNIRYHWFGDAWVGLLTQSTHAEPFVALTRTLFAATLISVAFLAWTWAGKFVASDAARFFAGITVFLGTTMAIGINNPGSAVLEKFSPTFTFGIMFLLGLSLLVNIYLARPASWPILFLVLIFAAGTLGGRITHAAVAVGGIISLLLVSLITRQRIRKTVLVSSVVAAGFIISVAVIFIQKPMNGQVNPWIIRPNTDAASLWGFIPFYNIPGYVAADIAVVLAVLAQCAGLIWLIRRRPINSIGIAWASGLLIFGFFGAFFTQQLGYSQLTLMGSAVVVALVPSGAGLGDAASHLVKMGSRKKLFSATVLFICSIGIASTLLWVSRNLLGFRFEGLARWGLPFSLWIGSLVIGLIAIRLLKIRTSQKSLIAATTVLLVGSSCLSAPIFILVQGQVQQQDFSASSPSAWTLEDFQAAEWIDENTPKDAIFATNRFCNDVSDSVPTCPSTTYNISALSSRQTLIEGYTYSLGADFAERSTDLFEMRDRIQCSVDFGSMPDETCRDFLWNAGVRWFVSDQLVSDNQNWDPWADVTFNNSRVTVLRLRSP